MLKWKLQRMVQKNIIQGELREEYTAKEAKIPFRMVEPYVKDDEKC